jgi:fucose permease
LATNAFAAAYDVIRKENRGLGGALVNMTGGISSGVMIYMAGIWKETVGFAGMVVWMMVVSLVCGAVLAGVAAARYKQECDSSSL